MSIPKKPVSMSAAHREDILRKSGPTVVYKAKYILFSRSGKFVVRWLNDYVAFDTLDEAKDFIDGKRDPNQK